MSKDAYYFSHDANARRDPRIAQMMSIYGFEGYGWYWALVEMMREQAQYKLDISGKYFYHGLSNELSTTVEQASSFIHDCINEFKLFKSDESNLWSESLLNRMRKYQKVVEQRREAGKISAQKRKENKDKSTPVEHPLNTKTTKVQQLNEIKQKETKLNKSIDIYLKKPTNQNLDCALEEIIIDCKNKDEITALILSDPFLEQYVVWSLYRKDELKKKLTKSGIKGQFNKLATYGPDIAILMIQKSIENGWTGIFELKDNEKPGHQKPSAQNPPGMSYEEKKDIKRKLHGDLSDAEQDLQNARDELTFNKKPTSEQRVQDAQRKVNQLRKELDI